MTMFKSFAKAEKYCSLVVRTGMRGEEEGSEDRHVKDTYMAQIPMVAM